MMTDAFKERVREIVREAERNEASRRAARWRRWMEARFWAHQNGSTPEGEPRTQGDASK